MNFIILRRRLQRISGVIFAFSLIVFVFCLLYISRFSSDLDYKQNPRGIHKSDNIIVTATEDAVNKRQYFLQNASWMIPPGKNVDNGGSTNWLLDMTRDPGKALDSIQYLNIHHDVLNTEKFGPVNATNIDYIIVVQVHDRIDYLKYLIGTLSRAKGIGRILLIFSYDLNSHSTNELIQSIDFCRVIHIFFPFNIQIFPNIFPGHSPKDCPEGSKKIDGLKCTDSTHPDIHGHFRVPKLAQIKHHWWWKANYAFDKIMPAYGLEDKLMILLEEDHIVSPDFLHILRLMNQKREKFCPDCELLCLGSYPKSFGNYEQDLKKLGVEFWYSSKFNMGMALNAKLWRQIQNCSKFFCSYDDYNWDWTLLQLSVKCLPSKMRVIFAKAPRVIHIGDCGVHSHRCTADKAVHDALKLFERVNSSLFPAQLDMSEVNKRMLKPSKPNGGWGDPRDRRLCELNTHPAETNAEDVLKAAREALEV